MQESDLVKTHRTRHHREETLLRAIFFFKFSIKKKQNKRSLWQLQREGWEGQEGKWETGQPAAVVWVRVDGSGLVVAHGLDLW